MRLQKIISLAGIASRREAERLIDQGKVTVNGAVIRQQGCLADPEKDKIKVLGRLVPMPEKKVYVVFNKPRGCLTTTKDDQDRPTVMDFINKVPGRIFPVGRLDFNTEGLLLLTNDGNLSKKLLDPSYQVPRTYRVKVRGIPDAKVLGKLAKGIPVDGLPSQPMEASIFRVTGKNSILTLTLREGKNRHIRKVCEKVRHPVVKINRIQFGSIDLTGLPIGAYRFLSPLEVRSLKSLVSKKKD